MILQFNLYSTGEGPSWGWHMNFCNQVKQTVVTILWLYPTITFNFQPSLLNSILSQSDCFDDCYTEKNRNIPSQLGGSVHSPRRHVTVNGPSAPKPGWHSYVTVSPAWYVAFIFSKIELFGTMGGSPHGFSVKVNKVIKFWNLTKSCTLKRNSEFPLAWLGNGKSANRLFFVLFLGVCFCF